MNGRFLLKRCVTQYNCRILRSRDTVETLRGVAKLCYYVSNSEQTTVSGVLHGDRRGSRRKTAVVFKQFGVRMRKSHLENMVR